MKKYLIFTFILAFSATLSAQTIPRLSTSDLKKGALTAVPQENMRDQILNALKEDAGLQKEALNYLKNNPETASSVASMAKNSGEPSQELMQSILGDKRLAMAAIKYISNNPKLLEKAMKLVGM